jgi:hypothetical protein
MISTIRNLLIYLVFFSIFIGTGYARAGKLEKSSSNPFFSNDFGVLGLGPIEIEVTDLDSGKKISTVKARVKGLGDVFIRKKVKFSILTIRKERKDEIPNSSFIIGDFNDDTKIDKSIKIPVGKETRRFNVRIFPEEGADPEAYFRVELLLKDHYEDLVESVKIKDIKQGFYRFEVGNLPPDIYPGDFDYANVGKVFTYSVYAKDPEGGELTCQAENLPVGMTFDPNTCTVTWTPTLEQLGDYEITMSVSDPEGLSESEIMKVVVLLPEPVIIDYSYGFFKGVNISWEKVPGAVGYNVYREDKGLLKPYVANIKKTSFKDTNVGILGKYSYAVKAIDSLGRESSQSAFVYIE